MMLRSFLFRATVVIQLWSHIFQSNANMTPSNFPETNVQQQQVEGYNVTFTCDANGSRPFKWYFKSFNSTDSILIYNGVRKPEGRYDAVENGTVLSVYHVQLSDTGTYSCRPMYKAQRETYDIQLLVLAAVFFVASTEVAPSDLMTSPQTFPKTDVESTTTSTTELELDSTSSTGIAMSTIIPMETTVDREEYPSSYFHWYNANEPVSTTSDEPVSTTSLQTVITTSTSDRNQLKITAGIDHNRLYEQKEGPIISTVDLTIVVVSMASLFAACLTVVAVVVVVVIKRRKPESRLATNRLSPMADTQHQTVTRGTSMSLSSTTLRYSDVHVATRPCSSTGDHIYDNFFVESYTEQVSRNVNGQPNVVADERNPIQSTDVNVQMDDLYDADYEEMPVAGIYSYPRSTPVVSYASVIRSSRQSGNETT